MSDMHSSGQILLHDKRLVQASCFSASLISDETKKNWSKSFHKPEYRDSLKKIKNSSIFLILSQNCDIACRNDSLDSTVEIAVCKKIKESDVFPGNSFVKSVRKLHFKAGSNWYEANIEYILSVNKKELLSTIESIDEFELIKLTDEYSKSVPVWRSNRYMRSALPDNFNDNFGHILDKHIGELEKRAIPLYNEDFSSYIWAIYIHLDSDEEKANYNFRLFALLRDETPDNVIPDIQDILESIAEELEEQAGYTDDSDIYAGRAKSTYVSYLTQFVRLNLDNHSLSNGDNKIKPTE